MKRLLFLLLPAVACISFGCANEPVAAPANAVAVIEAAQEEQAENEGGIKEKIGNIVEQVKSKAPTVDGVKKMFGDMSDATGDTADDAMNWANEMFTSLSESGLTTKDNVQDWMWEDWNNMNAWEYQVIRVEASNPATLQEKLNEAGKQRWDCFHVSDSETGTTFYLKRQKKSYMKSLPLKDMLKLVPLLDGGE